eukprot:scaffold15697_cov40-Cyclotella_meneghiniana.AAC.6
MVVGAFSSFSQALPQVSAAELFKDACKDEHQSQSFSGVGAQHQNAEAERAIQTVMYMARTFMIHSLALMGQ